MDLLPKEILVSIFKHLSQPDRVSVTQVCKLFCEIIEKFDLIEHLYVGDKSDESSTPRRKYSKATVKNYKSEHQRVFEAAGNRLTTLKLTQCSMNLIDIFTILRLTPNVKNLTFDYVQLDDDTLDGTVTFPLLVDINLLFNESDPAILRVLQESSLLKADLRFYADVPYSNFAEFVKVLKTQERLRSFAISGAYESNMFLIPMGKSKYKLKEFSIDNCDLEEWENLETYLLDHVDSLEKFVVKNVRWDPSPVLNQCKRLKSLQCHRVEMDYIDVLATVEELSLEPPVQMMDKFPNVKRLFISRSSPVTYQMITNVMNKLEEIEITFGGLAGLEVSGLKKLKLSSIDGNIDESFFVAHHRIEELQLVHVFNVDDSLLEAITSNLANLKILRILGDNYLTSRAFTIIKENCKNLKIFEMSKWDQKFSREDWKCLLEVNGLQIYTEKFN